MVSIHEVVEFYISNFDMIFHVLSLKTNSESFSRHSFKPQLQHFLQYLLREKKYLPTPFINILKKEKENHIALGPFQFVQRRK